MTYVQIGVFWVKLDVIKNDTGYSYIEEIKEKYQLKDQYEQITIRKAIEFIKDVWEIDFYFYDKLLRYLRKFDLLIEEEKEQRNWKLKVTYESIFKLMMMPLYELFKIQMKKEK